MDNSGRSIKIGTVISYITVFVEIILGLVYTPWILSTIGANNYYLYNLGQTLISFFAIDFALGSAVTRFVARLHAQNKTDEINKLLGIIYKIYYVLDLVILIVAVVIFFNLSSIYVGLSSEQLQLFRKTYVILVINTLITFPTTPFNGIMNAYENFIEQKFAGLLTKIFNVVCIIMALILFKKGGDFDSGKALLILVCINCLWNIILQTSKYITIKRKDRVKADLSFFDFGKCKEIFTFSIWVLLMQLAERLFVLVTPSIFGIVSNADHGAVYSLSAQLETYAFTIACAINGMFVARVSRLIDADDNQAITDLMVKVGKFQLFILGMIICVFFVIGVDFVRLWAGDSLSGLDTITADEGINWVYYGALFLFASMAISKTQNVADSVVLVKGKVKIPAFIYLISGTIYVAIAIIVTKLVGVLGTLICLASFSILRTLALDIYYIVYEKIDILAFLTKCHLRVVPSIIMSGGAGFLLRYYFEPKTIKSVLLIAVVTAVVFIGAFLFFSLTPDERKRIRERGVKGIFK